MMNYLGTQDTLISQSLARFQGVLGNVRQEATGNLISVFRILVFEKPLVHSDLHLHWVCHPMDEGFRLRHSVHR